MHAIDSPYNLFESNPLIWCLTIIITLSTDLESSMADTGGVRIQKEAHRKKNTVNVVIFAGGKFRENVGKTLHVGGKFHNTTPISFIKALWI